jgi:RNA polymerase sigma-70 factor (ECF subfamily)
VDPSTPAAAFLSRWRGPTPEAASERALTAVLEAAVAQGQKAWPTVRLQPDVFARCLAERAPASLPAAEAVASLQAAPLWLACGCALRLPEALSAFDEGPLRQVPGWLARLRPAPEVVEETLQSLREKLFLGTAAGPAKITQYSGKGPLEGWLRVAAVRTALNLLEARAPQRERQQEEGGLASAVGQPELDYIKDRYREEFAASLREAFAGLGPRERALLRFAFVDQLPPGRIGAIYAVHRTTAHRWLEEAQARLLQGTRERLVARLQVTPEECDSLLGLLQSRLDVTVGSLFRTGP